MSQHDDSHHAIEPTGSGRPGPAPGAGHALQPTDVQAPGPRENLPMPAAPAVEHDGWRASETIDEPGATRRFALHVPPAVKVAAVIAIASAFGALAGSFAAGRVAGDTTAPPVAAAATPDDGALKATVAQLQHDVAGMRTSLENSAKALQTQTARLTERLDRSEKAQAEPAQKLAKLGEAIERLERRAAQAATTQAPTASPAAAPAPVPAPAPTQAAAPPPPPPATATQVAAADLTGTLGAPRTPDARAEPPVVNGWVVRDVRRGIALVEGRYGLIEIETGDNLPGLGRIEGIRKQADGRWAVVTSRGLIVQR